MVTWFQIFHSYVKICKKNKTKQKKNDKSLEILNLSFFKQFHGQEKYSYQVNINLRTAHCLTLTSKPIFLLNQIFKLHATLTQFFCTQVKYFLAH